MREPILEVVDLVLGFDAPDGRVEAVKGVSFTVPANRTVALVGESGSGKTVISHAVLGILPNSAHVESGSIIFRDPNVREGEAVDLAPLDQAHPLRRSIRGGRISIIFQEPMSSLSPLHTIGDQVSEAYRLHIGRSADEARRETIKMLGRVGFAEPERAFKTYPFELSGGLRQRAMIAMALVCKPALLIADEPTTALDVTIQAQILKLIEDLKDELGMAVLFITHDLGVVANIADEVVVLYRGRVMEQGSTERLLRSPRHPYLRALLGAVPTLEMDRRARLVSLRDVRPQEGDAIAQSEPEEHGRYDPDDFILEVEGLSKGFMIKKSGFLKGDKRVIKAVEDVTFRVVRGEAFAIVGESGCGKTTVSKMIMRAIEPESGRIIYNDGTTAFDVLGLDEKGLIELRRSMQYIFQDPFGSLNPRMTIYDIIAEPMVIHQWGNERQRNERVKQLIREVGLDQRALRRYPHSFSGGQRQRIGIARSLALEPQFVICDEPVSALDVSVQAQILNLLKDMQRDHGLTYLFISHNLAVVRYIAQRIAVMCAGRLVELAPTDALFADPQHPYTRALLAAVPEPTLDHQLDFAALKEGAVSDPAAWPEPFALVETAGTFHEVADQHFVRYGRQSGELAA